jgi:hypothetical protein
LVPPSCFWSPTHFCTIISGQSSYSTTIQTIWPTTLGTSKLHTTYSLYHGTLYIMFKHTNVPPNCHNPNHTTNHIWNFKIRQHLCRNPTLGKCEDGTHIPKSGNLESFGTPTISELDSRGQNTSP